MHIACGYPVDKPIVVHWLSTLWITRRSYPLIHSPNGWKQKRFFKKIFELSFKLVENFGWLGSGCRLTGAGAGQP